MARKVQKTAQAGETPEAAARISAAARRILEEWTADWRVPYVPPPDLNPGLGIPQVFPGQGREDPLFGALAEAARLAAGFIASRIAAARSRGADLLMPDANRHGHARDTGFPAGDAGGQHLAGLAAQLARLLPPPAGMDAAAARAVRLAQERRKVCRRSTTARRPTADDIRAAWDAMRDAPGNRLRLGRLLMDLECFVDNGLVVRWYRKRPRIVARRPGIRGWIAENCPELVPKYKTLMRCKSLATRARQESGAIDPLPLGAEPSRTPGTSVRVQFRRRGSDLPRRFRFAWEHGALRIDANGRFFLTNENYSRAVRSPEETGGVSEEPGTPTGYNSQRPPQGDGAAGSTGQNENYTPVCQ